MSIRLLVQSGCTLLRAYRATEDFTYLGGHVVVGDLVLEYAVTPVILEASHVGATCNE